MPKLPKVVQELINKTYQELSQPRKPVQNSRVYTSSNGYIFLVAWSNASLLRILIRKFTCTLPKSEYRLKAQLDDAARSTVANIEEGFARPTTSEYITFLGYSQASLKEVKGDIQRSRQDGFLKSAPHSNLTKLRINLSVWHEVLKKSVILLKPQETKGIYRKLRESEGSKQYSPNSFKFLYSPVDNLKAGALSYEIFIELINKTDWHLRKLVESLEQKLNRDHKGYQIEKAKLRSKIHYRGN